MLSNNAGAAVIKASPIFWVIVGNALINPGSAVIIPDISPVIISVPNIAKSPIFCNILFPIVDIIFLPIVATLGKMTFAFSTMPVIPSSKSFEPFL